MYEVLTAVELAAIERLARSGPAAQELRAIEEALDEMDGALKTRDLDAWVRADERFHRMLVDLCGNRRLKIIADGLWDQGHRARITTVRLRFNPQLERSNREHRSVVRAIRKGDWEEARARHVDHRARTSREIVDLLKRYRLARV